MPDGIVPPAGTQNDAENSTIKLMREQIDAANREKAASADALKAAETARTEAEDKLKAIERGKLEETERLRLEKAEAETKLSELTPLRDEVGKYASAFEKLYNDQIAALPEEKRETAKALTVVGTWADRYEALQKVSGLIGAAPAAAGTRTQPTGILPVPGTPQNEEEGKPLKPDDIKRTSFRDALRSRPSTAPMSPKSVKAA